MLELWVKEDRRDFYRLDFGVLKKKHISLETGRVLGAWVTVRTEPPFAFNVFMFGHEVHEKSAKAARMENRQREKVSGR